MIKLIVKKIRLGFAAPKYNLLKKTATFQLHSQILAPIPLFTSADESMEIEFKFFNTIRILLTI